MAFLAIENASSSSSIPSSTPECKYEYEVFLSFRGRDTRNNFTDHLYNALDDKGIITFRDNEKLERGSLIAPKLLRAIEESEYAVVVLSKDYASSSWCLAELTKIIECMEKKQLIVLPVFHYVDPSDVRNQRETFAEAFAKHEKNCKHNIEDVQMWRAAFTKIANLAGWDLKDEPESKVIKEIIQKISSKMYHKFSSVSELLVGMDSREEKMLNLCLGERLDCVRFVGICGMGGIGKTTLAQKIYKRICCDFDASSFISNVRENSKSHGLVYLQKQLLSEILVGTEKHIRNEFEGINVLGERLRTKKALIVLDDVDQDKQLEALAGNHDWFGVGSRIIVTSRDCHLLRRKGVKDIYIAKGLNDDEALELFSLKAFKKRHPKENYVDLSKNFVSYAKGLPLALKVLGSSLFGRSLDAWRCAQDMLEAKPNRDIMNVLEISVVGLNETQRDLFLDIACFFKRMDNYYIRDTLESLGHYPDYNIDVLKDKSLITITSYGALEMHDLLQEMGQDIVRRESLEELGQRSRLWLYEDVLHVLKYNTGTEFVKGIVLKTPGNKKEQLSAEAFSKMKNLRLLIIGYVHPPQDVIGGPIQCPQGFIYLPNELRVLNWYGYPLKSMPTSFQPNKLVELRMHCSRMKQLWKGIMILNKLKLLDLSDSQNLIVFPDLSEALNLKQLILQGCTKLYKIHASIGDLKQLIRLDLNGCKNISSLPNAICCLMSLKVLNLSSCSRLDKLPENIGDIAGLEELEVGGTSLKELPPSMVLLKNLKKLSLSGFDSLLSKQSNKLLSFPLLQRRSSDPMDILRRTLSGLSFLTNLNLSYCNLETVPDVIGGLSSLTNLNLSYCNLGTVPDVIGDLSSLTYLNLSYCNLRTVPDVIGCLSYLNHLNLRGNNFVHLPKSLIQLSNLSHLYLSGCTDLQFLPELPLALWRRIEVEGCSSLKTLLPLTPEDEWFPGRLFNCIKLIRNHSCIELFLTRLRHYFLKSYEIELLIPGSEIPKWFSHQSEGTSLNLKGPSDFMGIALCAVFVLRQHHSLPQPPSEIPELIVDFYCEGIGIGHIIFCGEGSFFSSEYVKIDSHHLFFRYFSIDRFQDISNNRCSKITKMDANGFTQFNIRTKTKGLEVMKCGARLVYEKDIEDLKQNMAGSSSCSITDYEDDLDDSAKDTKIKRRHDDYDGDGAGSSREEPHLKWIQQPNLIENWIGNLCTQGQGDSNSEEEKFQ